MVDYLNHKIEAKHGDFRQICVVDYDSMEIIQLNVANGLQAAEKIVKSYDDISSHTYNGTNDENNYSMSWANILNINLCESHELYRRDFIYAILMWTNVAVGGVLERSYKPTDRQINEMVFHSSVSIFHEFIVTEKQWTTWTKNIHNVM